MGGTSPPLRPDEYLRILPTYVSTPHSGSLAAAHPPSGCQPSARLPCSIRTLHTCTCRTLVHTLPLLIEAEKHVHADCVQDTKRQPTEHLARFVAQAIRSTQSHLQMLTHARTLQAHWSEARSSASTDPPPPRPLAPHLADAPPLQQPPPGRRNHHRRRHRSHRPPLAVRAWGDQRS